MAAFKEIMVMHLQSPKYETIVGPSGRVAERTLAGVSAIVGTSADNGCSLTISEYTFKNEREISLTFGFMKPIGAGAFIASVEMPCRAYFDRKVCFRLRRLPSSETVKLTCKTPGDILQVADVRMDSPYMLRMRWQGRLVPLDALMSD